MNQIYQIFLLHMAIKLLIIVDETNSELLGEEQKCSNWAQSFRQKAVILPPQTEKGERKGERKPIKEKNQKKINKESPTDYSEAVDYTRKARSVGQTKF